MHVTQKLEKLEWVYDLLGVLYYFDTKGIRKGYSDLMQVHFTLCQISKRLFFELLILIGE